jgi:hypothetical protein
LQIALALLLLCLVDAAAEAVCFQVSTLSGVVAHKRQKSAHGQEFTAGVVAHK